MAERVPLDVFVQLMHDIPTCKEHGNKLDLIRNGPPSGYLCVCKDCECTIDAFEYARSQGFLMRAVQRLHREKQELEEQVEQLQIQLDQANAALQAAQEQLAKHQQRAEMEAASVRMTGAWTVKAHPTPGAICTCILCCPEKYSLVPKDPNQIQWDDGPMCGEYPIPLGGEVPELPKVRPAIFDPEMYPEDRNGGSHG